MDSNRLTRRRFIVAGAATAVGAAGAGLHTASAAGSNLVVGRFVRADGPRDGIISLDGGESVSVTLDSGAFVAHGVDGIVDAMTAFVPGEQVVARGDKTRGEIAAIEFQSVYTSVWGTFVTDRAGHWLETSSGQRVRVPEHVLQRDVPRGIARGASSTATIWTHPATGEATAVDVETA